MKHDHKKPASMDTADQFKSSKMKFKSNGVCVPLALSPSCLPDSSDRRVCCIPGFFFLVSHSMCCKLRTIASTRVTRGTFYGLGHPGLDFSRLSVWFRLLQDFTVTSKKIATFSVCSQNNDLTGLYLPYLLF